MLAPTPCIDCGEPATKRGRCAEHQQQWAPRSGSSRTGTAEHQARRLRILNRDGHRCQINGPRCTKYATVLDHVIALALGGADTDDNGQAACPSCNQWKAGIEANQVKAQMKARPRP